VVTKQQRQLHTILTMLSGVVIYFVSPLLLIPWANLGWRRPVQDWMIAHGVGSFAGHFGLFYIQIPDYIMAIIVGAVIGVVAWNRWWQLSLIYSGIVIVLPYLVMILDGSISYFSNPSAWLIVYLLLLHFAIIPLVLTAAILTSKPQRRRNVRRKLQLCIHCGYNLTGNTTGICSECGAEI